MTLATVDLLVEDGRRLDPGLDPAPLAVVEGIRRLAAHLERVRRASLAPHGLGPGDLDVLQLLHGVGEEGLKPTDLFRALEVSSGGMTARLDRLQLAGLLVRVRDPEDRRALRVRLTGEGQALLARVLPELRSQEAYALTVLGGRDREALAALLRKLLRGLEAEDA